MTEEEKFIHDLFCDIFGIEEPRRTSGFTEYITSNVGKPKVAWHDNPQVNTRQFYYNPETRKVEAMETWQRYWNSQSKGPILITDMPTGHIVNSIRYLERNNPVPKWWKGTPEGYWDRFFTEGKIPYVQLKAELKKRTEKDIVVYSTVTGKTLTEGSIAYEVNGKVYGQGDVIRGTMVKVSKHKEVPLYGIIRVASNSVMETLTSCSLETILETTARLTREGWAQESSYDGTKIRFSKGNDRLQISRSDKYDGKIDMKAWTNKTEETLEFRAHGT